MPQPNVYLLRLNYACNAKCPFCYQDFATRTAPDRQMSLRQSVTYLVQARRRGFGSLCISGGEPTTHPHILQVVAAGRRLGFSVIRILSNGFRLAEPDFAGRLARAGLNSVMLSLHSHLPEMQDKLMGVPGAYEKCMKAIVNLSGLRIPLRISCVINRLNYRQLPEIARLLIRLRQRGVRAYSYTYSVYEGQMWKNRELFVPLSEVVPYLNRAMEIFERQRAPLPYLRLIPYCFVPRYVSCVGMDEYTRAVDVTGIERNSWDAVSETRSKPEACRRCVYYARCPGLETSYLSLWGSGEIKPLARFSLLADAPERPMEVL